MHIAKNCVVCDRLTSDFSYGVDCCNACKMFFRRHVTNGTALKSCISGNQNCAQDLLAGCQLCRFHKCLVSGMTLEQLIPKLPLNDLIESILKLDEYRYQILSNYFPIDPDLSISTVLFFKRLMYIERAPLFSMDFSSWIYISAVATVEFMKKLPFVYLAKWEDQLILIKSSFMNVASCLAAFKAYSMNQKNITFPDGSDILPTLYENMDPNLREIGDRIRRRLVAKFIDLKITKEEFLLVLVLLFCNPALPNLSATGQILVTAYQTFYSSAMLQYCLQKSSTNGPARYSELLSCTSVVSKHFEDINNYFVLLQLHGIDYLVPSLVREGINFI